MRLSRAARLAVVPTVLLALAACGNDTANNEADMGDTASDSSAAPEEDAPEAGESVDPAAFAEDVAEGFENLTTAKVSMEMGGTASMTMTGEADYTQNPPAMEVVMSGDALQGQEMSMIMVDKIMYMSVPGQGGKYMKIDLADPEGPLAAMGMGDILDQMDMRAAMENYTKGLTEATFVGEEEIDGESLEHYEVTLDVSKMEGGNKAAEQYGADEVTYDAWFDDDQVMRRMELEMPQGLGTMEMNLSDLGAEVDIEAPPASQVVDMPGMPSAHSSM